MAESHLRSIAKALSYRLIGTAVTFFVALIVSRDLPTAAMIGLADSLAKIGAFYFHERLWERIGFGRVKTQPHLLTEE